MKKKLLQFISFISVFILFASPVSAARIMLVTNDNMVHAGERFSVDIFADTDGKAINSASLSLSFSNDVVSFSGYSQDNSALSVWVEEPKERTKGVVTFSGITPGGVGETYTTNNKEKPVLLTELFFTAKTAAPVILSIKDSNLLLNDGEGSPLAHERSSLRLNLQEGQLAKSEVVKDTVPPDPFTPLYIADADISREAALVSFQAFDKDSGIARYEAKRFIGGWHEVESPLRVAKLPFQYTLEIRAVDYNENTQASSILIPALSPIWSIIILLLVITAIVIARRVLKRKNR